MRKSLFYLSILILFSTQLNAQQKRQISLDFSRSFHGTGDMRGLGLSAEYGKFVTKRLEITTGFTTNIHHDEFPVFINFNGKIQDASLRFTTAGIQLSSLANLAIVHSWVHELKLAAGPLLRYQSSSFPDVYSYSPATQTYPEPVFSFRQYEPQEIISVGYLAALSYAYTFSRGIFIGAKASFQNDSNSDVITQYGLRIGKRF